MRPLFRRALLAAVATAAAAGMFAWSTAPPAARILPDVDRRPHVVAGAYHVHSNRSDGSGTPAEIAAAAAQAGLQFVILSDHGDLTRPVTAPAYESGVLVIDAAEVSSDNGHVVALGVEQPSAYPVAGTTRDVLEDIRRLGGWTVLAHPDSPRRGLAARAAFAAFDGVEWLNGDSEWRRHGRAALAATALRSLVRSSESIAALFATPRRTLERWDAALETRDVVGLAAVDAHARVGVDHGGEGTRWRPAVAWPGYETMFGTVVQTVVLDAAPTGSADADAAALLAALRSGRTYSVIRAFVDAADVLDFEAVRNGQVASMGGRLEGEGTASLRASVRGVPEARVEIWRGGERVATGRGTAELEAGPGTYRVEVYLDNRDAPWVVSNAIRIGDPPAPEAPRSVATPGAAAPVPATGDVMTIAPGDWGLERDATSTGTRTVQGDALVFSYQLGEGRPAGQYVALAVRPGAGAIGGVRLRLSSAIPMRVSVQVRAPGEGDQRWRRSFYVDETPRTFDVRIADLDPIMPGSSLRPIVARLDTILLVVDTVNALPGSTGTLTVHAAAYRRQ